jgi:hypothetical protein
MDVGKDKGSYEAHFNAESNVTRTSGKISENVEMPNLTAQTTWTWRTQSLNLIRMMCLEP